MQEPKHKDLASLLMVTKLNSASSSFGLKLPKPAGSIRRHEPSLGQEAYEETSALGRAQLCNNNEESSCFSNWKAEAVKAGGLAEPLGPGPWVIVGEPLGQGLSEVRKKKKKAAPSEEESSGPLGQSYLKNLRPKDHDFTSKACESYRPFIARDGWAMLEREMRLLEIEDPLPLVRMPLVTLQQLKTHLLEKFGLHTTRDVPVLVEEGSVQQHQEDIDAVVAEVERTRLLAVFVEEPEVKQDPEKDKEVEDTKESLLITLAALNGLVLTFASPQLLPEKIKNVLIDVAFVKISSKPDRDCQRLQRAGIRLRGWISSGAIYRALLNNEDDFCLEAQAKFLVSQGFIQGEEASQPSDQSESENLDQKKRFTLENVLVPIAVTLASALNFGLKRGYPEEKQMFPVVWEAVDLVRSKVPEDLDDLAPDPLKNWMVGLPPESRDYEHRRVNGARTLLGFRMMSADFVEVFDPDFVLNEAAQVPHQLFFGFLSRGVEFPTSKSIRENWSSLLDSRCKNCAKIDHKLEECFELGVEKTPVCVYPHDGVSSLPPHSTRLCPILHHYCLICEVQGHHPEVHVRQEFTHRELRERFFRHAHLGLLTSMPYLTLVPDARKKMTSVHWRGGYQGLQFRRDPITRYQLGVTDRVDFSLDPETSERIRAERAELVAVKLERVKRNAAADDPQDMKPISRDLLKLEKENLIKRARLGNA